MLVHELLPKIEQLSHADKLRVMEFLVSSLAHDNTTLLTEKVALENKDSESIKLQVLELQNKLKFYENKYQMSSEFFYQKFHQGELGDDIDFFEWNVYYEMLLSA